MRRLYDVDEMTELAVRGEDRGGLGCRDAMLFDGGPSAQMYLAGSGIRIEGDRVPAFVIARERRTR
jgi:exopolysaccharide biosynthesis protein